MKTRSTSLSILLARSGHALRSVQASLRSWLPGPTPVLVPIPVRADRRRAEPIRRHRPRGL